MRNPDKESKKAPSRSRTFDAGDMKRKGLRKKQFASVMVFLLCCLLFYVFGGGTDAYDAKGGASGVNTDTPELGSGVKVGRTKRENVDISRDYENRESKRKTASMSSFDWYDNEPSSGDAGDFASVTEGRSDESRLAEAQRRSQELLDSFEDGGVKKTSNGHTGVSGGGSSRRSSSDGFFTKKSDDSESSEDYVARRQKELREDTDRRIERIRRMAAGEPEVDESDDKETEKETVETKQDKVSDKKKGFYSIDGASKSKSENIRAVVHGEHKNLRAGATVKLRLLDPLEIDGFKVPRNTFVYGQLTFSSNRAKIRIDNINYENNIIPFKGTIYDKDGFEGICMPENVVDNATREAGSQAVSSQSVNLATPSSAISSGINAIGSAIKSAVSGSIKEGKVSISTNYQVTIKPVKKR